MLLFFYSVELYEICLVRAREKLKILRDVAAGSDTDSVSSFSGQCLPSFCSFCFKMFLIVVKKLSLDVNFLQ